MLCQLSYDHRKQMFLTDLHRVSIVRFHGYYARQNIRKIGMARIIEYQTVLQRLTAQGLRCHYPNGGSFGFAPEAKTFVRGWIGPPDPSIRRSMQDVIRAVAVPYERTLAELAARAWEHDLPGEAWLMPAAHWSFELRHGNGDWLAELIQSIGLDPELLAQKTDAAAIEFSPPAAPLRQVLERLLQRLLVSDFCIAFPRRGTVCTVHHHKQLWWVTTQRPVIDALDRLIGGDSSC